MQVKWIEKENNPFYPLPPDYSELTEEGKRLARINACRLWLCPGRNKKELGEAFATSVRFFDVWYLCPDHDVDFDPLFYDDEPLPSPPFHSDILQNWATSNRNITIAPRGSAKSFLVRFIRSCMQRLPTTMQKVLGRLLRISSNTTRESSTTGEPSFLTVALHPNAVKLHSEPR